MKPSESIWDDNTPDPADALYSSILANKVTITKSAFSEAITAAVAALKMAIEETLEEFTKAAKLHEESHPKKFWQRSGERATLKRMAPLDGVATPKSFHFFNAYDQRRLLLIRLQKNYVSLGVLGEGIVNSADNSYTVPVDFFYWVRNLADGKDMAFVPGDIMEEIFE